MNLQNLLHGPLVPQKYSPVPMPWVKDPTDFRERCKIHERKASISLFGLDFIIDKQGVLHCLEINGQYSGTNGFADAYGTDCARMRIIDSLVSTGLPVTIITNNEKESHPDASSVSMSDVRLEVAKEIMKQQYSLEALTNEEYFARHEKLRGGERASFKAAFSTAIGQALGLGNMNDSLYDFRQAEGIVWNNTHFTFGGGNNRFLLMNSGVVEFVLGHKAITSYLMGPVMLKTGRYLPGKFWDTLGSPSMEAYLASIPTDHFVVKPADYSCGDGVVVLPKRLFLNHEGKIRRTLKIPEIKAPLDEHSLKNLEILEMAPDYIVGPYIRSRPYHSPRTGKFYQGCIRYVAMVKSEQGNVTIEHIGGYVRLAGEPFGDSWESRVANITQGGHGAPLLRGEERQLRQWTQMNIPTFYRRILRMEGEKARGFETALVNVLAVEDFEKFYGTVSGH